VRFLTLGPEGVTRTDHPGRAGSPPNANREPDPKT
jgi:hypothetical protein